MPEIVLYYQPGPHVSVTQQREKLAVALAHELRAMAVKVGGNAGATWSESQIDVNIVQYHPQALNVSGLAITMTLAPGEDRCVFLGRDLIKKALCADVIAWLTAVRDAFPHALLGLGDLDIRLRFAYTAGLNCDVQSGAVNSEWG